VPVLTQKVEDSNKKEVEQAPQTDMRSEVVNGFRDGIPIAMGYFAVAFSLGIIAKKAGLTAILGFVSSFFTRASAGEYGVYTLVALNTAYVEIVAISLVANLRYMLMSAALSQKIAPHTPWYHRILMACCITDEVFGISVNHKGYTPPAYTYSAALISTLCWASGCAAGIIAGGLLPTPIVSALSVALYGMFIAIIMPPSRTDRNVLYAVVASFILSGLCAIAPLVKEWSPGTRTIVLTVGISFLAAWLKPIKETDHGEA
jgi:predicted branched-subunit amino acid permease